MVLRKRIFTSLSTGLLPLLSASFSHALVIQPVQVKSALGEPFYAEIVLSDLGNLQLKDISIGLANAQELSDLGVKVGSYQGTLDFNIQSQSADRGVIVVRSKQAINEPFIDFVLRIKNDQNTRLKRINAMIDPPVNRKKTIDLQPQIQTSASTAINLASSTTPTVKLNQNPPAQTSTYSSERQLAVLNAAPPDMNNQSQNANLSKLSLPKPSRSTAPAEIEVATVPQNKAAKHVVQNNESLWKIAKQLEPELKQPVGQIMQRIRDMNEGAFIAGDPNQLRRGATLILPENSKKSTLVAAPQAAATKKPITTAPTSKTTAPIVRSGRLPKAELTLVAPTASGSAQGNSNTGQNVSSQPLPREIVLKIGQERRKTVLMQHEVTELDAQLALNDKKIAMLNAKLAQLEQQLKMRNEIKRQPAQKKPMQAVPPKKAANAILPIVAFASMALFGFSPNMAHAADGDGSFPIWIIPIVLVVIFAIFKVIKSKSADKPAARGKAKRPVRRPAATTPARKEQPAARPVATPAAPVPVARPAAQPEIDVLQEVQSYIERDRFTQAVGLLKDAATKQPERVDIQVKLLEVFALQNDIDGFENQFNIVSSFNQPEISAHAEKMRALLQPKAEDFKAADDLSLDFTPSAPPAKSNEVEFETEDLDIPLDLVLPGAAADQSLAELEAEFGFTQDLASPAVTPTKSDNNSVNNQPDTSFDLSLDDLDTLQAPVATPNAPADQPVDLEFDVSDAFNLAEVEAPAKTPSSFDFDLSEPAAAPTPVAAPVQPQVNLDQISVEDTNWADGFDDQDFNIGTNAAAPSAAAANVVPAENSGSATDFLSNEFPFLVNLDVQQTNLELAESYINLGERASARELLDEVISQGNQQQQAQAQYLMQKLVS